MPEEKSGIKPWQFVAVALFWLVAWQLGSMVINQPLFLPSPFSVILAFGGLLGKLVFWQSMGNSLLRIGAGFFSGLLLGTLLAILAARFRFLKALFAPLQVLAKAVPVASFVILALVWFSSKNLSMIISFVMVFPVIYEGTLAGLTSVPAGMKEMAYIFRFSFWRQVRAVYLPAARPFFLTAVQLALGLCWKSGVAAEVIGLSQSTIGAQLYQAKVELNMPEMFAWTVVVILLSWLFARVVLLLLQQAAAAIERGKRLA